MKNPKLEGKEEKDMNKKSATDKKIGARKRRSTVEKRYMINYTYQDMFEVDMEGAKPKFDL